MRAVLLSFVLLLCALAPVRAQQALLGLSEGVQYRYLEDGQPYQPLPPGMVEVAEVFAYTCPHCAHFAPMLEKWQTQLPAHARLVLVPFVSDRNDPWARTYFAAQASKSLTVLHPRLFVAIHETSELPRDASTTQIAAFVSKIKGVNAVAFKAALQDEPAQLNRLRSAFEFERRTQVESTPSLIVAGHYLILGNSFESLLGNARAVIDALAPQKAASPKATPAQTPAKRVTGKPTPSRS